MGLDQYLYVEQNFYRSENLADYNDSYRREFEIADKVLNAIEWPLGGAQNVLVRTTAVTWRKANQIHRWFVENVQDGVDDCGTYYVPEEKLQELINLCDQVIAESDVDEEGFIVDPSLAEELLPAQEGFFFGSYEYDQWYLKDLEFTRRELKRVLENLPEDAYLHYSSSW